MLREGVEALLIIMVLLAALQAANQTRGQHWVIGGASLGVVFSIVVALALVQLFPLAAAGTNREILEGAVGIAAVIVMIFVGAWLHSKASLTGWQAYIKSKMGQALAQGSLIGLGGPAFLSGGSGNIGVILIAYLMKIFAQKLPIHLMFRVMNWLIYALGFKILGVSVYVLCATIRYFTPS
ncbi:FTR1 family protein [Helicobacter ganmani]|uniref:FTR1 family protein n=1 Tax=Helicobacter ganmani TaxID=60246 RepID=UPI003A8B90C4